MCWPPPLESAIRMVSELRQANSLNRMKIRMYKQRTLERHRTEAAFVFQCRRIRSRPSPNLSMSCIISWFGRDALSNPLLAFDI